MKRFLYFMRNYQIDLWTYFIAIILAIVTYYFYKDYGTRLIISSIIITISLLVIMYTRVRKRDFVYSELTWRRDKRKWIGIGDFDYSAVEKAYFITNSDQGYINSECFGWIDYKMNFDFRINHTCLGALLRAKDLSNYVMLQIGIDGINPHLRISGGWIIWKAKEINFDFLNPLSMNEWYHCDLSCYKGEIGITITNNKNLIFHRTWEIPNGNMMLKFDQPTDSKKSSVLLPFPINLEFGTVGFRNCGDERAFIKNVLVEKI